MSRLRVEKVADQVIAADSTLATGRAGKEPPATPDTVIEPGGGIPWLPVLGGGIALVLVVLIGGSVLGVFDGGQPAPTSSPTPSPTPSSALPSSSAGAPIESTATGQVLTANNAVKDQTYPKCQVSATIVFSAADPSNPLNGTGTIEIKGPTLAGTQTVAAANGTIEIRLDFAWAAVDRTWTVTLVLVDGVKVVGGSPDGTSTYTHTLIGDSRC